MGNFILKSIVSEPCGIFYRTVFSRLSHSMCVCVVVAVGFVVCLLVVLRQGLSNIALAGQIILNLIPYQVL